MSEINADNVWAAALDILSQTPPRVEPIKLTRDQWDTVAAAFGHNAQPQDGVIAHFAGVRVELVDDVANSTPHIDGWAVLGGGSDV